MKRWTALQNHIIRGDHRSELSSRRSDGFADRTRLETIDVVATTPSVAPESNAPKFHSMSNAEP